MGSVNSKGGEVKERTTRVTVRRLKQVARKGASGNPNDRFWSSRYLYRPLSIYVAWAAIKLRLGPGVVTLFGALCLFAAAVCYASASPSPRLWVVGGLLVFVFVLADHADGEVARFDRYRRNAPGDRTKEFYDTCAHGGEAAVTVALALRFFVEFEAPLWLLLITILFVFPGSIGPWRRYCETIVKHCAQTIGSDETRLPSGALSSSSLVHPRVEAGRSPPSWPVLAMSHIGRTLGSPDYLLTLLLCTILDVWPAVPTLRLGDREIPYLLIWFVTTSLYHAATSIKSTVVYSRRLKSLAHEARSEELVE